MAILKPVISSDIDWFFYGIISFAERLRLTALKDLTKIRALSYRFLLGFWLNFCFEI